MEGSQSEVKAQGVPTSTTQADPDLQDLLRQLMKHVGEESVATSLSHGTGTTQEVVLDVHVNGTHYILTRSQTHAVRPPIGLSARELEIVRLVSQGLGNKVIAAVLDISPWTVATHLRRVFGKLGVSTRAEMIARVLKDGLLEGNK